LLSHRVFLDMGHDEYWPWSQRDNVEAALAAGVNLVFASDNESYWNTRLEASPVGPNRILTCYKDAALDPTPVAPGVTVEYFDPLLNRPENGLVGLGYEGYADDALYNGPWVFTGPTTPRLPDATGLHTGHRATNLVA